MRSNCCSNMIILISLCRLIDHEEFQTMSFAEDYGWTKYYNLDATYKWLDQLLEKYPKILTNFNYGKSYEGRQLRAVKVSHKEV